MIEPTIGRVVWYHPNPAAGDSAPLLPDQPYAALVAGVNGVRDVNLVIFNHGGYSFERQGVKLAQDDEQVEQGMCEWMPFQKGQALMRAPSASVDRAFFERVVEELSSIKARLGAAATPAEPGAQQVSGDRPAQGSSAT